MPNLVDLLTNDHEEVKQLFSTLETATGSHRVQLFAELRENLVRHEVAEEEIVRPLTRQNVPSGDAVADARIKEESEAESLLKELEDCEVGGAHWLELFARLRSGVLAHAGEEERHEFPLLRQHVNADDLDKYAQVFESAKKLAPTHPHPHTPNTTAANFALGPVAALMDRAKDALTRAMSGHKG